MVPWPQPHEANLDATAFSQHQCQTSEMLAAKCRQNWDMLALYQNLLSSLTVYTGSHTESSIIIEVKYKRCFEWILHHMQNVPVTWHLSLNWEPWGITHLYESLRLREKKALWEWLNVLSQSEKYFSTLRVTGVSWMAEVWKDHVCFAKWRND